MKNIVGLMKQASEMQKKMEAVQAELEALRVEGSAGAGMVKVVLSGKGQMLGVTIDPKLADPAEMEMLQDLILAAHADAKRRIDETQAELMRQTMGPLAGAMPPGLKF